MIYNGAKHTNLNEAVKGIFTTLDKRQRDVLEKRYGLVGGEPMTLAAIGDGYKITRERVRQIEALSSGIVRKAIENDAVICRFIDASQKHLKTHGGLRRDDLLLKEVRGILNDRTSEKEFPFYARFVLEVSGQFRYAAEDNEWHTHWYLTRDHAKKARGFIEDFAGSLAAEKEAVLTQKKFTDFLEKHMRDHGLTDVVAKNFIVASKRFATNQFGDVGLATWSEINPKTARDWAYLVLKKEGHPLHFTELAASIAKLRIGKPTNPQTVHNELIKDARFVLVGRGIYALRESGVLPGTAREVISHFLKKNGPMKAREVVKVVLKERPFKENTVLINLQNKNHFTCLADGRYCIRES